MAASLEDYLSQLPVAKRITVPTDQECAMIANEMTNWEVLISNLGLTNTVMSDIIDANPRKSAIQRIEVLKHYKQTFGKEATFANLVKSFYTATRRDLVEKVIEVAKSGAPAPQRSIRNHHDRTTIEEPSNPVHFKRCHCFKSCKASIVLIVLAVVFVVGAYSLRDRELLVKYLPNSLADVLFSDSKPRDQPTGNNNRCVQHLILEDAHQLSTELADIGDWESLCFALRLHESVLNSLRYEHNLQVHQRKLRCLEAYLKTNCANWVTVVEVVCMYPFHDFRLAKKLAKKHRVDISSISECH